MTQYNAPAYDIERPTGQCAFTGRMLQPGEPYMAVLVEIDAAADPAAPARGAAASLGLKRLDVSLEAWDQGQRPPRVFSYWRSTVPQPNQRRRLFVDDEVLLNLFRRLGEPDQAQVSGRAAFRFVLALILMRKRLLRYEASEVRPGAGGQQEWWRMVPRGSAEPLEVLNPRLDEEQIQQVTQQLGEVLEGEV